MNTKPKSHSVITGLLVSAGILGVLLLVPFGFIASVFWEENQGPYTHTSVVLDIDGDGDLDVVTGNIRNEGQYSIWPHTILWTNDGRGKFTPTSLEAYHSPAPGDVDGDGDVDLAVMGQFNIALLLNQGGVQRGLAGAFKPYGNLIFPIEKPGLSGMSGEVVTGDLNQDGQVDGFVSFCCGLIPAPQDQEGWVETSYSWVWINDWDPRGWLNRHTLLLPELDGVPIRAAALGDLNGDGSLDVFAAATLPVNGQQGLATDYVLFNDGQGSLRLSTQRLSTPGSYAVALGDLDGDGDLDALVGTETGAKVWINQGGVQAGQAGIFATSWEEDTSGQTASVYLADLDGDGDLDALLAGKTRAAIWWNDSRGAFTQADQRFRYSERTALAVGDFNGDGRADIFTGEFMEKYTVRLNQGDGKFQQ
ncbi:MAG: FG-GAP-like repeat-containing protein [Chloroflexi bacterium]|nr:FG-GAP-like repeat-containing protein [Chloroflexota bacterium]